MKLELNYRSSGAGGQHVNTTDSAVRKYLENHKNLFYFFSNKKHQTIKYCKNLKKMHLKQGFMSTIKNKREKENLNKVVEKFDIGWGHQIRSYVLQLIKLERS